VEKKPTISFRSGDENLLDSVESLWVQLNRHMQKQSIWFKQHYADMTFERRKQELLIKAREGKVHIDIAYNDVGQAVGYCASSVDGELTGEVESIVVDEKYQRRGIGDALMRRALAWMDLESAKKKMVAVAVGNEQAFGFYSRFGFKPRKTVLETV
jgi:ribosomal protein S18 acetylase RimI-like enzyme